MKIPGENVCRALSRLFLCFISPYAFTPVRRSADNNKLNRKAVYAGFSPLSGKLNAPATVWSLPAFSTPTTSYLTIERLTFHVQGQPARYANCETFRKSETCRLSSPYGIITRRRYCRRFCSRKRPDDAGTATSLLDEISNFLRSHVLYNSSFPQNEKKIAITLFIKSHLLWRFKMKSLLININSVTLRILNIEFLRNLIFLILDQRLYLSTL